MGMGVELYHRYAGQGITDAGSSERGHGEGLRIRDRDVAITVRYTYIVNIITVQWSVTDMRVSNYGCGVILRSYTAEIRYR
jgi:hypothetical protein